MGWMGWILCTLAACTPVPAVTTGADGGDSSSSAGAETSASASGDPVTSGTGGIQTVTSATESAGTSDEPTGSATTESTMTSAMTMTTTMTSGDTSTGDGDTTTGMEACPAVIDALTAALTAGPHCDLVVQIDGGGLVLGWGAVCGDTPGVPFTEKTASQETACCQDSGILLNDGTSPFLIHDAVAQGMDGGLAIVSNAVGGRVFETTIGADGPGTISAPEWKVAGLGVGEGCSRTSFGFANTSTYNADLGGGLSPDILTVLADALETTALPAAFAAGVGVDLSVVIGYKPELAAAAPVYVVLLELSPS